MSQKRASNARIIAALLAATVAFAMCFVAWTMFGVVGIPIRKELGLDGAEFGLLTATPILTGAIFRFPLGLWTDRFGGRIVMTVLLLIAAVPLWLTAYASALVQFLVIGLAMGLVGASFAVGTPYVSRLFPNEKKGFAMGVFGAGTSGAALNMFIAPALVAHFGWQSVPKIYAVVLALTAIAFWLIAAPDPVLGSARTSLREQFALLRDPRLWKYAQYYSIVFGGFTALAVWLPQYVVSVYHVSIAEAALLAACFALPAGVLRALGGYLADRLGAQKVTWWVLWLAWICLFLLSYPSFDLVVETIRGPATFHIAPPLWAFAILLFVVGVAFANGMASTFKYLSDDFPDAMGIASGLVGMAGGLGGFLLPILFGVLLDWIGVYSTCFMLLYGIVWVSLILLYSTEIRRYPVVGAAQAARMKS